MTESTMTDKNNTNIDFTKTDFTKIVRQQIVNSPAYSSARSLVQSAKSGSQMIYLDANELSAQDSSFVSGEINGLNRYPDPQPKDLVERLCHLYSNQPSNESIVLTEEILVTRGIDEGLEVLFKSVVDAGLANSVYIAAPTYGMYEVLSNQFGGRIEFYDPKAPQFEINSNAQPALIFLCRPNNPTGESFTLPDIEKIYSASPRNSLVVVDEAYQEFSLQKSALSLRANCPRLLVARTLSKAWGLAGVRMGSLIGHPDLISLLKKALAPYPFSHLQVREVLARTTAEAHANQVRVTAQVVRRREMFKDFLSTLSWVTEVFPTEANYVLFRCTAETEKSALVRLSASARVKIIRDRGFLVRDRSRDKNLESCIRISIGSAEEMISCMEELKCL